MKKLIVACLAVLLMAAAPAPRGFVNDLANIIPDDREAGIEKTLHDYEVATSIEIAVVTTPSLEGKEIEDYSNALFKEWGVGKRGANNGVLIVVAPTEHKYRIEVGYGLEGDLTDAASSVIGRENFVPAFRAGDYAGGIENAVQAVITQLGTENPEQRAAFRQKTEEAARQRRAEFWAKIFDYGGTALVAVLVGLGIFGIALWVRGLLRAQEARRRIARRRTKLRATLSLGRADVSRLMAERSVIDLPSLPTWMQDDKERHSEAFGSALERIIQLRKEIEQTVDTDIERAEGLMSELNQSVENAHEALGMLRAIPEKVQVTRDEAEQAVVAVCTAIDALVARTVALQRKQYRVTDIVPALSLDRLGQEKESITAQLASRGMGPNDASDVVHDKAIRLLAKVQSLQGALDASIQQQSDSARRIAALQKRIQTFPALLAEHRARLECLQGSAPRARWAPFVAGLSVFERTLGGIAPRLEAAVHANGMDVQLFAEAAATLAAAETSLGAIEASIREATALESGIASAQKNYPTKRSSVERALSKARRLMTDSDVGSGAKSRLAEAQRILDTIQTSGTTIDWLAVLNLLEQASAKVDQASRLAQSDIDDAERERRRRRDEEERRQRLAREASAASYSSSTNDYGSSSSGSSFGGFGGGDSGGGGASGSW